MQTKYVRYLICPDCRAGDLEIRCETGDADNVEEGALVCGCGASFRISEGILDLTPSGLSADGGFEAQRQQREHFDWYADNEIQSYLEYQQMPFWRAFDDKTLSDWDRRIPKGGVVLDLACGDGRCAGPLADGRTVLACDISRKQIVNASRRWAGRDCFFFVGDAQNPPIAPGTIDAITLYGALHHIPDPEAGFHNGMALLKPGGVLLAAEPNLTVFRPLFDFLMRVLPIWHEEANDDPLISRQMVRSWAAGAEVDVETSVFIPPHVCNWLGTAAGRAMFRATEALGKALPLVRNQGGIILIAAQRA